MSEIIEFLKTSPLFEGMSALELNAVSAFLEVKRFSVGNVIFREGDIGSELYIVRSGLVGSFVSQSDGEKREIYEFPPGRFFGEMAIIESAPRSATCYAKEKTELLILEGLDFFRLVWEHPVIGVKLLSSMARVMVSWLSQASGFLGDLARWGETARRRAVTDDLSGLFNRRFLEESMRARLVRGAASSHKSSLLMLDIDRFRDINAKFGSAAGDSVISTIGATFGLEVGDSCIAARLSGDEFAFFLPDSGPDFAMEIGEKIRVCVSQIPFEFRAGERAIPEHLSVTVSIGAATVPLHAKDPESLISAADMALFQAKNQGRNCVRLAK